MKNKVLVLIFVPSLEVSFEFYIPINKKIGTIKNSIVEFIQSDYGFSIKDTGQVMVLDKETGTVLNENVFVKSSEIRNGTKLLLI